MLAPLNGLDEALIFSSQVRAARGLCGWSQGELARQAKISVAAIARIELGTTDCRMSTIQALKSTFMQVGIEFIKTSDGKFGVLHAPHLSNPSDNQISAYLEPSHLPREPILDALKNPTVGHD